MHSHHPASWEDNHDVLGVDGSATVSSSKASKCKSSGRPSSEMQLVKANTSYRFDVS